MAMALVRPLRTVIAGPSRLRPLSIPARRYVNTATAVQRPSGTQTSTSSPLPQSQSGPTDDTDPSNDGGDDGPPPKSAYARFKLLTKKYGWYALGMYTALSAVDFSLSFLMVHTLGVERIQPVWNAILYRYRVIRHGTDEADKLQRETEKQNAMDKAKAAQEKLEGKSKGYWGSSAFWAEAVLAYGIHKTLLLPLRAGLTVAWTPKVVNWLASRGWIGKGGFGRAATHAKGKVQNAAEKVKAVAQRD